jgi:hypothetical protein
VLGAPLANVDPIPEGALLLVGGGFVVVVVLGPPETGGLPVVVLGVVVCVGHGGSTCAVRNRCNVACASGRLVAGMPDCTLNRALWLRSSSLIGSHDAPAPGEHEPCTSRLSATPSTLPRTPWKIAISLVEESEPT